MLRMLKNGLGVWFGARIGEDGVMSLRLALDTDTDTEEDHLWRGREGRGRCCGVLRFTRTDCGVETALCVGGERNTETEGCTIQGVELVQGEGRWIAIQGSG